MGPPFPGNWSFDHHPWLREIHDTQAEHIVGQKAAQMGYTETALNLAFYYLAQKGKSVLYVLPNSTPDASDFSSARFAPALETSEYLRRFFTDTDNVGHKRAGGANLYVRGSNSRNGLKSIPVEVVILDELDEMNQENVPLAKERVSGQLSRKIIEISTPTIEGHGIHASFTGSDQRLFYFPCPSCNRHINLEFPRNCKITAEDFKDEAINNSYYFCHLCEAALPHAAKGSFLKSGVWAPSQKSTIAGFHINQMYSFAITPGALASKYLKGRTDPFAETEFHNSALGLPYSPEGARVTDKQIQTCLGEYQLNEDGIGTNFVTIGVDVGKLLHVEIDDWYWEYGGPDPNVHALCKVIQTLKLHDFEQLDDVIRKYRARFLVIDINPERRKVHELVNRWPGIVEACEYPQGVNGRNIVLHEDDGRLQVDRTSWLDLSLGRYHNRTISLPVNIGHEYREHMKALTRIYERDRQGNPVSKYVRGNKEDHFAHARNYAEIAFTRAVSSGGVRVMSSPV